MSQDKHAQQGLPDMKLMDAHNALGRKAVVRRVRWLTVLVVLLLLAGLGRTLILRQSQAKSLTEKAKDNAVIQVVVTAPRPVQGEGKLTLPGTLQGIIESNVYARVPGYVKQWTKDLGASVKKGEVLAILDVPELTRQVEEAQANHQIAKTAYERWSRLRTQDAVSQQELDEKTSQFKLAEATLLRLKQQLSYGTVTAPFDGVITKRLVNLGDLVNAGNGGASTALFSVAKTDRLRVYAYVPQDKAQAVQVGDDVELIQTGKPDKPVKVKVARTAGAVDLATRTLQIEMELPNADGAWLPGTYVDVRLNLPNQNALALPTNTLLFGAAGTQVAVVKNNAIERRAVVLGVDYGRTVEIRSGLDAQDKVVVNPPDSVANGQAVRISSELSDPPKKPQDKAAQGAR